VPVNPTGTANLNVQAVTPDGSLDSAQVANQAQPVMVVLAGYNGSWVQGDENAGDDVTVNWTYDVGGDSEDSVYVPGYHGQPSIEPRGNGLGAQPMERLSYANSDISPDGPGFTPPPGFAPTWQNEQSSLANDGGDSTLATTVTVASAGPSVVGQSQFYLVEACAMEFSDPYDDDYNLLEQNFGGGSTGDVPVPPEFLEINGQPLVNTGETNTDGSTLGAMIISAPAGATPQFTVEDDSSDGLSDDFTFTTPIATNLTLQILDANNGNANLSSQTNTVIVGQQMNLTCQLSVTNSYMTSFPLSNFQWTVPGYAISNYVVAADTSSAMVITNFPINNSNVVFYWVDGASNRTVQCSATVQGQKISGQAIFNIISPTVDWIGQITGAVAVDTNYVVYNPAIPAGLTWLHLGNSVDEDGNLTHGIVFTATNLNLNGYNGEYNSLFCVQTLTNIEIEHCLTNGTSVHATSKGMDTTFPFDALNSAFYDSASAFDAPATTCLSNDVHAAYSANFQIYLMFQAMDVASIPVPLKMISWNFSGSASTNHPPEWSLTSSNINITVNNQQTADFPQWSQNVTNYVRVTNDICN
jgi:hypothetical protein